MSSVRQSKTTHSLMSQLEKVKGAKQSIVQKLNEDISKNREILDEPVRVYRTHSQKTVVTRERSIELFQHRLEHRKEADRVSDAKLQAFTLKHEKKKEELERRLEEIAKRNANRLQELKELEQKVLKRINSDIHKNEIREKHLKEEYQRIRKEEDKLKEVKKTQKKESAEQWQVLQTQKHRLELLARQNEETQNKLIEGRSPPPVKKPEKRQPDQKYIPKQKEYQKIKGSGIINSKEMGKRYLEQAKLIHREALVNNKKKKLMNLNLKVIGYNRDIMDRIFRNTSDLSKLEKLNSVVPVQKDQGLETKQPLPPYLQQPSQDLPQPKSQFLMAEDLETQRYLKQIKVNLDELQKINSGMKEQKGVVEERSGSHGQMIVPTTLERQ